MYALPALLGNNPIFDNSVRIARPFLPDHEEMVEQMRGILQSGIMSKGPHLRVFEKMVAEHLGVKHAVAVSSCTSGLMLTYQALGLTGNAVVPSFTFMATVSALIWAGVRPVFADMDRVTINLDPAAAEAAITRETTALVAVHTFGNPADIEALQAIADRHGLRLIFDAAHGFGSSYQDRPLGHQGDVSVFSLSPTKLLVAGEGGIVATNDDELAQKVRVGREYGNRGDYDSAFAGINARMPELSALVGQHSLRYLESSARHRNQLADTYRARLGRLPGLSLQEVRPGNRSSYKDFSITLDPHAFGLTRDELATALGSENVETRKYYHPPVHRQFAYQQYATPAADLVNTDLLASRILSLPIWSNMETSIVSGICSAVERAYEFAPKIKAKLNEEAVVAGATKQGHLIIDSSQSCA